jgi:hypothetical protein
LLIDVDGPLNPWDNKPCRRPDGYSSYRLTGDGRWFAGRDFRKHKGLRVWLNSDHGRQIAQLAAETSLRPVWATTWLDLANTHVAPTIGLPELPVISFPDTDLIPRAGGGVWSRTGGWKWPGVATWADGVPLAWWDDEHDDPLFAAARHEFLRARGDTPTLLCHVSPRTGLLNDHYDQIRAWAAALPLPAGLPEGRIEMHVGHCCSRHGCKYGTANCPVTAGMRVQDFPCEQCLAEAAPE